MAVLVQEPADSLPGTGDWQQQLRRTSLSLRGFFALDVTEKSTDGIPQVVAGSMFEMDDSLWRVTDNEQIGEMFNVGDSEFAFCYARQIDSQSVEFVWRSDEPEYDAIRKGWYGSAGRCVLSAYIWTRDSVLCKALRGADFISKQTHPPPPANWDSRRILFQVGGDILTNSVRVQPGWYLAGLTPGVSGFLNSEGRFVIFAAGNYTSSFNRRIIWIDKPGTLVLVGGRRVAEHSNPLWAWNVYRGTEVSLILDGDIISMIDSPVGGIGGSGSLISNLAVQSRVQMI